MFGELFLRVRINFEQLASDDIEGNFYSRELARPLTGFCPIVGYNKYSI